MDKRGYYIPNFLFPLKEKKKEHVGGFFPHQSKIIRATMLKNIQASHIIHKIEVTLVLSTVGRVGFHLQPATYFYDPHKKQPSPSSVKSASALCTRHAEEEAIATAFPGNMPPFTG